MSIYRLNEGKELALYTWVASTLGIITIWDKPDEIRPPLPYATLNIPLGSHSEGPAEERYKKLDTWTYPLRKLMTLTVNIYANNAYLEYMDKLINSLSLPTVQDSLRSAGLVVRGHSDPVDISRLLDTIHEFRVSADIFLAYAVEVDDIPGEIQKVTVAGTIGKTAIEQTIDVTT